MILSVQSAALLLIAAIAALVIRPLSVGMTAEQRPATLTTEELRQRLIASHARIRAWYVEYESAREDAAGEPAESYSHRVVAAKAPDHFFHWSTHGTKWLDWREDPYQQRLTLTPSRTIIERPSHRQFRVVSLPPDAPLPGSMPREFLFTALGWWPFEKRPPPSLLAADVPRVLPAIARSPKYVVNPRQELARGHWCHILECPNHDKLWLDCEHGCAILAREIIEPDKGFLAQRIEASEHRQIQTGIWVPFEFRNMIFHADGTQPPGGRVVKTLDAILKVIEVRLNEQVPDSIFRFEPLPGSIQSMEDGRDDRTEQVVPGGTDYLDEVIDWINRHFAFPGIAVHDSGSVLEAVLEYSIISGGIVFLIAHFLRRRLRAANVPGNVVPESDLTAAKTAQT